MNDVSNDVSLSSSPQFRFKFSTTYNNFGLSYVLFSWVAVKASRLSSYPASFNLKIAAAASFILLLRWSLLLIVKEVT